MADPDIGRVVALYRYPVKSMAAEPLAAADVSWHGLAGDRRWAFVRPGLERSGFPWLTIRERSDLCHFRPAFTDPDRPDASPTSVTTPGGARHDVADPELARELGEGVRVIKQDRGAFDALPLSLMTTQTVAGIEAHAGRPLDVRRFRPNLVVEAREAPAFQEDAWIGATLRIGSLRMRVDKRDKRCVVVNVDPGTAERDPRVLRAIAQQRDAQLGVYGSVVEPGRISLGDVVLLEDAAGRPGLRTA